MPLYNDLRPDSDPLKDRYPSVFVPALSEEYRKRAAANLVGLRAALDTNIVPRKTDRNLLVGSWNLKELGHTTQRLPEAYFYTAEIISRLDLVVVQEVKSSLEGIHPMMQILGDDWAYVMNDITEGTDGNSERSAFIYNKKRVQFGGLAGEIVMWPAISDDLAVKQLKRAPFITGFRAGWKMFAIVNLHLQPDDSPEDFEYRKQEMTLLLRALKEKKGKGRLWNDNLILAGDFNFYDGAAKDDPTIQMIADEGYRQVEKLKGVKTNASGSEAYDRLFIADTDYFTVAKEGNGDEVGGVFNVFDHVYRDDQVDVYKQEMIDDYTGESDLNDPAKLLKYYKHPWRKNQISDHFPIWVELVIDSSDDFLGTI